MLTFALLIKHHSHVHKIFLVPNEPLQAFSESTCNPPLGILRDLRQRYVKLLLEKMRAPDGNYADGFLVPTSDRSKKGSERAIKNLDTNNPLSLHNEVRILHFF